MAQPFAEIPLRFSAMPCHGARKIDGSTPHNPVARRGLLDAQALSLHCWYRYPVASVING
jgi:hypothetical protein